MNFCIIGGDLRNFYLAKQLLAHGNIVSLFGFENIEKTNVDENNIESSNVIILPMPFTKDNKNLNLVYSDNKIPVNEFIEKLKEKIIFSGNLETKYMEKLKRNNCKIIDIMKDEEFAILNAISTAEATIEIMLKNSRKTLQSCNCLVMGFGRIGKILFNKLKGLNANVTCIPMNGEEKAWSIAYGQNIVNSNINLYEYDIIVNTIPKDILKEKLRKVNKETLIIDVASKPYGIDRKIVEEEKLNFIEALALPREIKTNYIS